MPTRFFVFHHTAADTVERIAAEDVSRAAAAIAAVTWVVAEMPERLPDRSRDDAQLPSDSLPN